MKKSEIKNIIKEEVSKALNEDELQDQVDILMVRAEADIDRLLKSLHERSYDVAGENEGPGVWHAIKNLIKQKV